MDATCEIEVFGSFQYIFAIDLEYCDLFLHKYLNETIRPSNDVLHLRETSLDTNWKVEDLSLVFVLVIADLME